MKVNDEDYNLWKQAKEMERSIVNCFQTIQWETNDLINLNKSTDLPTENEINSNAFTDEIDNASENSDYDSEDEEDSDDDASEGEGDFGDESDVSEEDEMEILCNVVFLFRKQLLVNF